MTAASYPFGSARFGVRRVARVFAALIVSALALATFGGTGTAHAVTIGTLPPLPPIWVQPPTVQSLFVRVWTGSDGKRDDSAVRLVMNTKSGSQTFTLSDLGETLDANTNKAVWPLNPSPQVWTSSITSWGLVFDGGAGDGWFSYQDQWDFAGIDIWGLTTSGTWVPLFDNNGGHFFFAGDGSIPLVPPANLSGAYNGTVNGDLGSTAPFTLTSSGAESVSGTVSLASGLQIDSCGTHSVGAQSFSVSGTRTGNNTFTGESDYTLTSAPFPVETYTATVTITGHLSGDGVTFSGTAAIDTSAPFNCGDKTFTFSATR